MTIDVCFFDIGQVLVQFHPLDLYRPIAAHIGVSAEDLAERYVSEGWLRRYETGQVSTDEVAAYFRSLSHANISSSELLAAAGKGFEPMPGVQAIVEALKQQGTKLILLSNTCDAHWHTLRHFDVMQLFDDACLSFEVAAMKPDAAIYHQALALAGVAADRCFFTDDLAENIEGAAALGIRAFRFSGVAQLHKDLASVGLQVD